MATGLGGTKGVSYFGLSIDHAVWVPAFAGTTVTHRQCSNRVSSQLISRPTASPNSDRITTPANS